MTYNQVSKTLRDLLESHAMIKTVKSDTPQEWIKSDEYVFPMALYSIGNGSLNLGREQVYTIDLWFLDKSGQESEFEEEVISDQLSICADIVSKLRLGSNPYTIDTDVTWQSVRDKFEDYMAGVQIQINLSTKSDFDACDFPT